MKKNAWKYVINALMFVDVCSMALIGLILALIVPSGGGGHTEKTFLGIHRHSWADIHFFLSIVFLSLLTLHVWLNWTWVVESSKKYFGAYWQRVLWGFVGASVVVLLVARCVKG
jgi:hypothetical protein